MHASASRVLGLPGAPQTGPPRHHAASGHEYDDAYMEEFDRGYAALAGGRRIASASRLPSVPKGAPAPVVSDTSVSTLRVAALGRQWYKGPIIPEGCVCVFLCGVFGMLLITRRAFGVFLGQVHWWRCLTGPCCA
jgi:hypothetical protein